MSEELQFMTEVQNDSQWLEDNYNKIQEKYPNKFVAIASQKIIASGDKVENVIKAVKETGRNPAMVLIEFIPEKGLILIL